MLLLYHYTDFTGLIGILNKHDLWLTQPRYSNDAEEMVHGTNVARKVTDAAVTVQSYDAQYLTGSVYAARAETPCWASVFMAVFLSAGSEGGLLANLASPDLRRFAQGTIAALQYI